MGGEARGAIALVMAKKELSPKQLSSSSDLPKVKSTLVICPMIAVMQWANEIGRFTLAAGSNKKKSTDAGVDERNKEALKKGKRLSKDKASGAGSSANDSEGADKGPREIKKL
ncbi:hypothetical protein ACET3Z_001648 [Daucus carota]